MDSVNQHSLSLVCITLDYVSLVVFFSLQGLSCKKEIQGVGRWEEQSCDQDSGPLQRAQRKEKLQKKTVWERGNSHIIALKNKMFFNKDVPILFVGKPKRKKKQRRRLKNKRKKLLNQKRPQMKKIPLLPTRKRKPRLPWFSRATTGATKRERSSRREKRRWLGLN